MNQYEIYQLNLEKGGSIIRDFAFRDFKSVTRSGFEVEKENYSLVYSFQSNAEFGLEDIYRLFNGDNRPSDFTGRSLSVSDIVRTNEGYWYCDTIGWKKLGWAS